MCGLALSAHDRARDPHRGRRADQVEIAEPDREHLTDAGATVVEQATPVIRRSLLSLRGFVQLAREVIACWGPMRRLLRQTGAATVVVNGQLTSPEQFGSYIREETARWTKVIKTANIKPE